MLKSKSKILFCIFLIIVLISSVCLATDEVPTTYSTEDEQIITSAEWINDDLYVCEENVVIDGIVDGNVFAIGSNVTVTAEIGGDLFVIADTLNIDGAYIYSSIFAIANEMNVNGSVYDIYALCNKCTIGENGSITRDFRAVADSVNISGKIRRNAYITSENITFSELANTYIYGNLTYTSRTELSIAEGAVAGTVTYEKEKEVTSPSVTSLIVSEIENVIGLLINTLIVCLLAIWLTPKFIKKVSSMGIKKSLICFLIGLGVLIFVPVIVVILLITVIGIPVSLALLAFYILLIAFSTSFSSIALSGIITKKLNLEGNMKFVLVALASTVAIWLLRLIPYVGGLVGFLSLLLGLGTVVFNLFTKVPEEVKE